MQEGKACFKMYFVSCNGVNQNAKLVSIPFPTCIQERKADLKMYFLSCKSLSQNTNFSQKLIYVPFLMWGHFAEAENSADQCIWLVKLIMYYVCKWNSYLRMPIFYVMVLSKKFDSGANIWLIWPFLSENGFPLTWWHFFKVKFDALSISKRKSLSTNANSFNDVHTQGGNAYLFLRQRLQLVTSAEGQHLQALLPSSIPMKALIITHLEELGTLHQRKCAFAVGSSKSLERYTISLLTFVCYNEFSLSFYIYVDR